MPQPVVRESLVDQLSRRMRDDILAGRYEPGTLLPPERDLAREYGVTRTSLKHTLVRLEQAGLISTRHGVGSVVRDFAATGGAAILPMMLEAGQEGWLDDVFEVRRLVGALIAREAARRRSEQQAGALRATIEALAASRSAAETQRLETAVHRLLAEATGNRVFVLLTNTLADSYLAVAPLVAFAFSDANAVADLLGRVVDAVCRADAEAAQAAADAYLSQTGTAIERGLTGTTT